MSSSIDYLYGNVDDIKRTLGKYPWIADYQIFMQSIDTIMGEQYDEDLLSINQRDNSGVALRIITTQRRYQELQFSLSSISKLKSLTPPKSTVRQIDAQSFPSLKNPRIGSIMGDDASSTKINSDLLIDILNKYQDTESDYVYGTRVELIKENRLVTNSSDVTLTERSLKAEYQKSSKFELHGRSYSLSRTDHRRNLNFNHTKIIEELTQSIELRIEKRPQPVPDNIPIIFHPKVIGRLLIFHAIRVISQSPEFGIQPWDSNLQLLDDPERSGGYNSTLFDDEGSLTKPVQIIDDGHFSGGLKTLERTSFHSGGNGYRTAWFEPLSRSYRYNVVPSITNLILVGGTGKGEYFTDIPGYLLYIRQGYGYTGIGRKEANFVIHTNEVELWKDGTKVGPVDSLTVRGNLDELMKSSHVSADEIAVVDSNVPGSAYLGWVSTRAGIVDVR